MSDGLGFLTAVYRDGRVHIGGKSYPAGTFAVQLLKRRGSPCSGKVTGMYRSSYVPGI